MQTRRRFLQHAAIATAGVCLPRRASLAQEAVNGPVSLRAHAEAHGLLVGCAVAPEHLTDDPQYARIVAEQANILVAENAMKWRALRPTPTSWNFGPADRILDFAQAHKQQMRGHNLCWHQALPDWFASVATKQNARRILVEHIRTVAGRYAGKLHAWDVVNEAVEPREGREDGLRKSPWLELIGPDYIESAFQTARAADATALLTYNDYGIELDTPDQTLKREKVLDLVRRLKLKGIPIHAVGVQSHLVAGDGTPGEGLRRFVRELAEMDLQVCITELDVDDHKLQGSVGERQKAIAKIYADYLKLMLAEPNVSTVLTWGITDKYTWLNHSHPRSDGQMQMALPFGVDYTPSPNFLAMKNALDERKI